MSILKEVLIGVVIVGATGLGIWTYASVVNGQMKIAAEAIDKKVQLQALSGWSWFEMKLLGWKTHILALLAAGTQAFSLFVTSDLSPWQSLPWTLVFEEKIANWVTFGIAALIPLTHSFGMKTAATTPPVSADKTTTG